MKKKGSKKIKKLNKNELKKVKGGKEILGKIMEKAGVEFDDVAPAIDVGKGGRVTFGLKIKW